MQFCSAVLLTTVDVKCEHGLKVDSKRFCELIMFCAMVSFFVSFVCVCVCVRMRAHGTVCVCTCVYVWMFTCVWVCTYMHVCVCVCTRMCVLAAWLFIVCRVFLLEFRRATTIRLYNDHDKVYQNLVWCQSFTAQTLYKREKNKKIKTLLNLASPPSHTRTHARTHTRLSRHQ